MYQRTVDYPEEFHNGHHVMMDTEVLVTVRWEQVEAELARRAYLWTLALSLIVFTSFFLIAVSTRFFALLSIRSALLIGSR